MKGEGKPPNVEKITEKSDPSIGHASPSYAVAHPRGCRFMIHMDKVVHPGEYLCTTLY
jgi:hypothetical protein